MNYARKRTVSVIAIDHIRKTYSEAKLRKKPGSWFVSIFGIHVRKLTSVLKEL
jgi:hypothetical protein